MTPKYPLNGWAAFTLLTATSSLSAEVLIDMDFEDLSGITISSGTTVQNSGTAGDGTLIGTGSRPLPAKVSGFNSSTALQFPDQQSGPGNRSAVTLSSSALDNATEFTIAFWFRSTNANPSFPTLSTIFSTQDGNTGNTTPGVFLAMNVGGDGKPQPYLEVGDGTNGGSTFYGSGGWGEFDGNWHFLAVTFDTAEEHEFRMYSGDGTTAVSSWGTYTGSNFDTVTSTGDSALDEMWIGDGPHGWSNLGSFNGDLDKFYVANTALSVTELEVLRSTAIVPEPSSYALLTACLALGWVMVRRRG